MTENQAVSDYIDAQPAAARAALRELRGYILQAAPEAEEKMNYGIPAYALLPGGKRDQQIMMAGHTNHVGFYPHPEVMSAFATKLVGYRRGKGSVQFPLDRPLPASLILKMVRFRLAQLKD